MYCLLMFKLQSLDKITSFLASLFSLITLFFVSKYLGPRTFSAVDRNEPVYTHRAREGDRSIKVSDILSLATHTSPRHFSKCKLHMQTFSSQYLCISRRAATVLNLNKYFMFELKMCSNCNNSISRACICISLSLAVTWCMPFFCCCFGCRPTIILLSTHNLWVTKCKQKRMRTVQSDRGAKLLYTYSTNV